MLKLSIELWLWQTCELIWLKQLLQELRFEKDGQMTFVCDNQVALHIASNPVFHERTKHIEVDYHFIREKIVSGCMTISFVNSSDQQTDIFTKSLRGPRIQFICNKLCANNLYARIKILIFTDISVLGFYGYIGDILVFINYSKFKYIFNLYIKISLKVYEMKTFHFLSYCLGFPQFFYNN